MKKLTKKDVKIFMNIFRKWLDNIENNESINNIELYMNDNDIECIVTNTDKIVYAYGKRVIKYLNCNISSKLKEIVDDKHFGGMRSSHLEIVENEYIDSGFYCEPLKTFKAIGCVVFFYKQTRNEEMYNLLVKINECR